MINVEGQLATLDAARVFIFCNRNGQHSYNPNPNPNPNPIPNPNPNPMRHQSRLPGPYFIKVKILSLSFKINLIFYLIKEFMKNSCVNFDSFMK